MIEISGKTEQSPFAKIPFNQHLLYVLTFNTIIALTLSYISSESLVNELIYSHCIGLSIFAAFLIYGRYFRFRRLTMVIPLLLGSLVGLVTVLLVSVLVKGVSMTEIISLLPAIKDNLSFSLVLGLGFGSVVLYFILSKVREITARQTIREHQLKLAESEKQLAQAQLRLLQAQIEPHFLFNTLSNIAAMIEVAPQSSRKLLEDLTHYLRAALHHSRNSHTTLGEEIKLLEHFLSIHKVRMEGRVDYRIDVPQNLLSRAFPPMLLQPLVENAVKHGIEPSVHGGEIRIEAEAGGGRLRITVSDTGLGLQADAGSGFGIANIRERLKTLYDGAGTVEVRENTPHGVVSILEVPDEQG